MKAMLVARDIAPSNAFKVVANELQEQWAKLVYSSWGDSRESESLKNSTPSIKCFAGSGKELKAPIDEIVSEIRKSDIVLVGMSSSAEFAKEEIAACRAALSAGVPYGLYADTFGCAHNRNWFESVRADASFVFVLNDKDAREAEKVFPKAKVVASGNPMWDGFYFPKLSYAESRAKLGIKADEVFVLVAGHKPLAITMPMWADVLEALNSPNLISERKWQVVFSRHPGDRVELDDKLREYIKEFTDSLSKITIAGIVHEARKDEKEIEKKLIAFEEMSRLKSYHELAKWNGVPARIISTSEMATSDMVPGCDILIGPASTTETEAVCQRKPVITYMKVATRDRLKGISGGKWELAEQGVTYLVEDPVDLADMIGDIFFGSSWTVADTSELRNRQQELYPKPVEKGLALRAIVSTLQEFAKS